MNFVLIGAVAWLAIVMIAIRLVQVNRNDFTTPDCCCEFCA